MKTSIRGSSVEKLREVFTRKHYNFQKMSLKFEEFLQILNAETTQVQFEKFTYFADGGEIGCVCDVKIIYENGNYFSVLMEELEKRNRACTLFLKKNNGIYQTRFIQKNFKRFYILKNLVLVLPLFFFQNDG